MMIFPRYVFEQVNKKILVHSLIDDRYSTFPPKNCHYALKNMGPDPQHRILYCTVPGAIRPSVRKYSVS
jgi:hypothetical protein